MDIKRKKRIIVVIKGVIKGQKGSFTIGQLKEKMKVTLKNENFNDVQENEKEVEEFVEKMQKGKKLFRYNDTDSKYFVVH